MPNSLAELWPRSSNPNAPIFLPKQYTLEENNFAGILIGGVLYGVIADLFFRCMSALLSPVDRTRMRIRWGLVVYTAVMFSFATIFTAMTFEVQSISYVDNRKFPGSRVFSPGPIGYQYLVSSGASSVIANLVFTLNQWLADGFLLYRCYIIYAMNYWVIALPSLMYLASVGMCASIQAETGAQFNVTDKATGIVFTYQTLRPFSSAREHLAIDFGTPYYAISLALNILLTLMIVVRLVWHNRNIRSAMGATHGASGLYKTIITILVESCAFYTVGFVLYLGPWDASSPIQLIFYSVFTDTQVIASFLVTLRVANRTALTSDTVVSGNLGSIHFRSQGKSTETDGTILGGVPLGSMEMSGEILGESSVGVEDTIEEVPL